MREGTARAPLAAGKRSRVLEAWCTDGGCRGHAQLASSFMRWQINFLNQKLQKLDHFLVLSFQFHNLWQLAEGPSPSFVVESSCFSVSVRVPAKNLPSRIHTDDKLSNVCRCSRPLGKMPACCCCCCHPVDGDGTAECECAFVSTRNACACKHCHPDSIAFTLI
jgi:hypothetical protein